MDAGLDAGELSAWAAGALAAIRGEGDAVVPCGSCTACCESSQFVHIAPDELDALAHIPRDLLFPAPRAPRGHVLMGYDEHGRCPMLVDGACTIYEHRPRTCRTYDCRVFAATGLDAGDDGKPAIAARAARWTFSYDADDTHVQHDAMRAAAAFVRDRAGDLPAGAVSVTATQRAVMALELHDLFIGEPHGRRVVTEPAIDAVIDAVSVVLTRRSRPT